MLTPINQPLDKVEDLTPDTPRPFSVAWVNVDTSSFTQLRREHQQYEYIKCELSELTPFAIFKDTYHFAPPLLSVLHHFSPFKIPISS